MTRRMLARLLRQIAHVIDEPAPREQTEPTLTDETTHAQQICDDINLRRYLRAALTKHSPPSHLQTPEA